MKVIFAIAFQLLLSATYAQHANFSILQGNTEYKLLPGDTSIILKAESFTFLLEIAPYSNKERNAVGLAATINSQDLIYFQEGNNSNENPFYSPTGTGIAADGTYEYLYIGESGQHYLYYEPGEDRTRMDLVRENANGTVLTEWRINKCFINGKERKLAFLKGKIVYMMIWNDLNVNSQIDRGEYTRVTLQLN